MPQQSDMELNRLLARERAAREICAELNNFVELAPVLKTVLAKIKSFTTCQAVAVRLHMDGDYPYYVWDGFAESFIQKESSLCHKDDSGGRVPETDRKGYLLECMCGNIIRGRFDPGLSFFTKGGSFWTKSTSVLLASTSEDDRQSTTRNRCNSCGYESVALIPIKAQSQTIGLLQLNDRRKDMFTLDLIEYLEMLGAQIGLAVRNAALYSKLKQTVEQMRSLHGLLPICAVCKRIKDDKGFWHRIESYIAKRSDVRFSHGLCPACIRKHYPESEIGTDKGLDFIVDLAPSEAPEEGPADAEPDTAAPRRG